MHTRKLSFSKKLQLKSSREFTCTFKNACKITMKEIVTFISINNFNFPRIGIIISKKYIKHAHKRNKIKRLIRESFRKHQYVLPKMDFIITIRKNIINLNNKSIKQTLKNTWQASYDINFKITNKINTNISNIH